MNVGDRVKFLAEHNSYEVQAVSADGRWVVATKPFNLRHTVIYTLIDTFDQLRGVDNSLGNSLGYETRAQCEEALALIVASDFEYSRRHRPMDLDIEWVHPSSSVPDARVDKALSSSPATPATSHNPDGPAEGEGT